MLPTRQVHPNLENAEFWAGTVEGRFILRRCDDCQSVIWYPRAHCPVCMSTNVSSFDSSGNGTVYSFSITRKGGGAWRDSGPYVLAYVELDEGPRVLTNIVGCPPEEVHVGQAVHVVFEEPIQGTAIYRFAPR
jgi:uncharacterized OB-fold protein